MLEQYDNTIILGVGSKPKSAIEQKIPASAVQNETAKLGQFRQDFPAAAEVVLDSRRGYHRAYYAHTAERRRKLASVGGGPRGSSVKCSARLTHVTVPVPYPVRRPILGRRR